MLTPLSLTEFFRFICAGIAGFVADYLTVLLCVQGLMLSPYPARVFSFMAAVLTTYAINRRFTFSARIRAGSKSPGLLSYMSAMLIGLCANYGVYAAALGMLPAIIPLRLRLFLAVGAGSLAGMGVNFLLCRGVLFTQRKADAGDADSAKARASAEPEGRT